MKREQIIKILQENLQLDMPNPDEAEGIVADAILSLPLDLPSIKEINDTFPPVYVDTALEARGAKWMRREIIKRNKPR